LRFLEMRRAQHLLKQSKDAAADARQAEINELRHRGWRGGIIAPHRAFASLPIRLIDVAGGMLLATGLSLGWIVALPQVGRFWSRVLAFWTKALRLDGAVVMAPHHWGSHVHFGLPYVNIAAGALSPYTWWLTAVVVLVVFSATCFMPEEKTAVIYLLRFLAILQGTALVYFAFAAARFPHDLPSYTEGMFLFATILIAMVPWMLGFTYYIFDFSFLQKLGLTLICMGYLTLFVPFQYMLHVYILHKSILFMPMLYFAFGPFLDVLIFVCLYSWGMSYGPMNRHAHVVLERTAKILSFPAESGHRQ
jgi:hypothetical protein